MQDSDHHSDLDCLPSSDSKHDNQSLIPISSLTSDLDPSDSDPDPLASDSDPALLNHSSQNPTWSKTSKDKAIYLPILLIFCLHLIDLPLLVVGVLDWAKAENLQEEIHESSLLPPLQFISENLNADPIMELQLVNKGATCPSGLEVLKLDTWPGTFTGCLCEDGTLYALSCYKVHSPTCKKDISRTSPIDLFAWNGSLWCAKRAVLGVDYVKKGECPPKYKECYPGGCFAGDCPITKVELSSDKGSVLLERTQGEPPVIYIQLALDNVSCSENYKLLREKNECDKYGLHQQLTTQLASQKTCDFYLQNSFPANVMDLPYFVENATAWTSTLSYLVRMKTAKHDYCQDISEIPIKKFLHTFPSMLFLFSLIIGFLGKGVNFYMIIFSHVSRSEIKLPDDSSFMKILYFNNIIAFIATISLFISFEIIYPVSQIAKEYLEGYASLGCFSGGQGEKVINAYVENSKDLYAGSWVYLPLLVSQILSSLACVWLFIVKKKWSRDW